MDGAVDQPEVGGDFGGVLQGHNGADSRHVSPGQVQRIDLKQFTHLGESRADATRVEVLRGEGCNVPGLETIEG
jgi:hypothetical protein